MEYGINGKLEYKSIREMFKPLHIEELCIRDSIIREIKEYIRVNDHYNVLLFGNTDTGKTSIVNVLLYQIYGNETSENVFIVNGLEQLYIKTDFKQVLTSFCRFHQLRGDKKKKTIVIDDVDYISEYNQHIVKELIDQYAPHIHFIFTCSNKHKVIRSIFKRIKCIRTYEYDYDKMINLVKRIKERLCIGIREEDNKYIVDCCVQSIRLIYNFFEKLRYIRKDKYDRDDLDRTSAIISDKWMYTFTEAWREQRLKDAIGVIHEILSSGHYVIDFLETYFYYILYKSKECEDVRLDVIQVIGKYISYFHSMQNYSIALYFFTNDLCSLK